MRDRLPLYPGRVQLTPVSGQPNVYDMVRADQPTQEGDPLNKATFLQDTVAALFGKDGNAVPNDIFKVLSAATLQRTANQPKYNEVTIDLSTAQVGDIINLPFNGVMTPHIVVNVGNPDTGLYDSSCNGVWLLMQDIYDMAVWDAGNSNDYGASDVNTDYLPNTVLPLYSSAIQNGIVQAKIPYVNGTGSSGSVASGANGLSTKLFLLSGYEVGWTTVTDNRIPVDGSSLDYFSGMDFIDSERIGYLEDIATYWALRSPSVGRSSNIWGVLTNGGYTDTSGASQSVGIRPAFVMPTNFSATVYTDDGGNVYDAQEYYNQQGLYDVLGNLLLTLPGVQIETGSYVGTGKYGSSNPNSLTFEHAVDTIFLFGSQTTGSNYIDNLFRTSACIAMSLEQLTTNYQKGSGFAASNTAYSYGKKSADNKTVYWYNTVSQYDQCNQAESTFYYFAIFS